MNDPSVGIYPGFEVASGNLQPQTLLRQFLAVVRILGPEGHYCHPERDSGLPVQGVSLEWLLREVRRGQSPLSVTHLAHKRVRGFDTFTDDVVEVRLN
ncbi:hypothetical protein [Streptomyces sp. SCSIO ZS0520]|uniref:hypothetical protein n=1 Tax=Streptomyces sp. SCSIO ZS0520 TaxID=2892996 RepID=UPI0021D900F7|nr:hypothetical protein [Streptomyces sp. SCSIO ZS0520]